MSLFWSCVAYAGISRASQSVGAPASSARSHGCTFTHRDESELGHVQGNQQGGTLIFDGRSCVWQHYDVATAAHADPDEVLQRALQR